MTIPTTSPDETLSAVLSWFKSQPPISAIGIASFGPVDLDRQSPSWGSITQTTKPGWSQTSLAQALGSALGVPTGFDTDVNGAAIAEVKWGAAQGCAPAVYVTVGTGIGGGAIINGTPLRGFGHPEMGHIGVVRHPDDQDFEGTCPFHSACCEGLASGPAILKRFGVPLSDLPHDHPGHAMIAGYLAQLTHAIQAILAPQRIIMGGGVMKTPGLIDGVRKAAAALASGYFKAPATQIIVPPGLGENSGLLGAFALAEQALG